MHHSVDSNLQAGFDVNVNPIMKIKSVLTVLCSLLICDALHAQSSERPNILFIFLDDFGWKDTGYMGSDFYETPHLDRLAREGMIFTQAYSAAANCAPARASLLSGQYTPRHQVFNVGTRPRGKTKHRRLNHIPGTDTLRTDIQTWAHRIQKAGYRTATMVKWHLSDDPIPYGFDVNVGGTHSGGPPRGYYPPHGKVPGLQDVPDDEFVTTTLSRRAVSFIESSKDQPWFLYLTMFAVHTPIQAKKDLLDKYEAKTPGRLHHNAKMATMIQAVDDGVGRIAAKLEELGLTHQTAIVFFSDNGGYGPATDMAPLKGYKGAYYEGGIREPFFVKWPGVVEAGTINETHIIGVDLYPTFLEMTGATAKDGQVQDGLNLVPLFKGGTLSERSLFWHFPAYLQSYGGKGPFEQRDPLFRSRPVGVVRHGDWKLMEFFESGDLELYNLKQDIGESRNLANSHPETLRKLHGIMKEWRQKTGAPIPSDRNPSFDPVAEKQAIEKALALRKSFP
ncbi:MAG: sulfatase [Verrucomicrobiae bacterium]|nr:sulfatase [Verrucomicrobiae bacterium]